MSVVDFHRAFFIPFWEREGVAAPDGEAGGWLAALGRRPRFGADAVAERTASKLGSWGPGEAGFSSAVGNSWAWKFSVPASR